MASLISCGIIKWYLLFPILGGLAKMVADSILYPVIIKDIKLSEHPFISSANTGLGLSMAIIPFIFLKINSRTSSKNESLMDIGLIYNKDYKKNYKKSKLMRDKFLLLLFCVISDFIQKFLMFALKEDIDNNIWLFDILFFSLFSFLILKTKLYKHQIYSLIIIFSLGIILNILTINDLLQKKDVLTIVIGFSLSILLEIIFCFTHVIHKYVMEYKFCTPYEIIFYEGIFMAISYSILLVFTTKYDISKDSWSLLKLNFYNGKNYIDNFYLYIDEVKSNRTEIIIFIVHMFCRLFYYLFSVITIKYYTPSHIVILLIMGEVQFAFSEERRIFRLILLGLTIFIVLIMILVFTEIIELNFCDLSKNIKKNIEERAILKDSDQIFDESMAKCDITNDSNEFEEGYELGSRTTDSFSRNDLF